MAGEKDNVLTNSNQPDPRLKKSINDQKEMELEQRREKQDKFKQEARAYKRAEAKEKESNHFAKAVDEQIKGADEMIKHAQAGYDTWAAAMAAQVAHCHKIVETNPLGMVLGLSLSNKYWDLPGKFSEFVASKFDKDSPNKQPVRLPDLQYFVDFKGDKLDIASLSKNMRRSDGLEFTPEQKELLQSSMYEGVVTWLDHQGYALEAGTKDKFVSKTDPNDHFDQTKLNDKHEDLDKFFSGKYDMSVKHAYESPRPTPLSKL